MNKREKGLAIGVGISAVLAVLVLFLPDDFSLATPLVGAELDSERRQFRENYEWLRKGEAIRRDYERVEAQFPERVGARSPEATFSDEVVKMLQDRGIAQPTVKPAEQAFIDAIEDYYYIDLEVGLTGKLPEMIALLAECQKKGLLIKSFELRKNNPDRDAVQMDVKVARLAKVDETQKKNRRARGRR